MTAALVSRPKPAKTLPTYPIGVPMPAPMAAPAMGANGIPEPASIVGDLTHKVYDNLGDNPNGPESLSITPPGGQTQSTPVGPAGGQGEGFWDMVARLHGSTPTVSGAPAPVPGAKSFADGTDPNDPITVGAPQGQIQPPAFAGSGGLLPDSGGGPQGPSTAIYNQQSQVYADQQAANQAAQNANVVGTYANGVAQNALGSRAGVISATANTFGPQSNYIAAERAANDAAGQQNQQTRALVTQQGQDIATRTAEEQALQKSAANVGDLAAVAQAQQYRTDKEASDQRFDGLSAPQQIVVPPGDNTPLPAGVEAKLQTQNEQQQTQFSNADKLRGLSLESAKNIVDLAGTNSVAAALAAKAAGFTVDEAKQKVAEAQNVAAGAQINVDQANLKTGAAGLAATAANLKASGAQISLADLKNLPPGTAIWEDPTTGNSSIVSQAEYDANKMQYANHLAIDNAPNAASANYANTIAGNATKNTLEAGYLANPGAASTPTDWIVANTTRQRTTVTGAVYTNPGLLTRRQAIDALMAHGWSGQQAWDATAPDTSSDGTGTGTSTR